MSEKKDSVFATIIGNGEFQIYDTADEAFSAQNDHDYQTLYFSKLSEAIANWEELNENLSEDEEGYILLDYTSGEALNREVKPAGTGASQEIHRCPDQSHAQKTD